MTAWRGESGGEGGRAPDSGLTGLCEKDSRGVVAAPGSEGPGRDWLSRPARSSRRQGVISDEHKNHCEYICQDETEAWRGTRED